MERFILASKSPRRRELIEKIGIKKYKIIEANIDESVPEGMSAQEAVVEIALKKAQEVYSRVDPECIVIAADTMVVFDGNCLGKPEDESEAFAMLNMLSGMWHEVMTGMVVINNGEVHKVCDVARIKFRELSEAEIEGYIATGEPMDKAGAYGAQGLASLFVERIEGDFFGVMGLPLYRLGRILSEIGIDLLSPDDMDF